MCMTIKTMRLENWELGLEVEIEVGELIVFSSSGRDHDHSGNNTRVAGSLTYKYRAVFGLLVIGLGKSVCALKSSFGWCAPCAPYAWCVLLDLCRV